MSFSYKQNEIREEWVRRDQTRTYAREFDKLLKNAQTQLLEAAAKSTDPNVRQIGERVRNLQFVTQLFGDKKHA